MYTPSTFRIDDQNEIEQFIHANAFGTLTSIIDGKLFATHLPFSYDRDTQCLHAHMAKANPQWKGIKGQEVLVVLQGEHAYISPSLYENGGVPTWNYQSVHLYGKVNTFDDSDRLEKTIRELTNKYEAMRPEPCEPMYSPKLVDAIIGLEIQITEIECKYKVSQNRPQGDRENVLQAMREQNFTQIVRAMEWVER